MSRKKKNRPPTSKRKGSSILWIVLLIVASLGLVGAYFAFGPNTGSMAEGQFLYIRSGSNYQQVKEALDKGGFVRDMNSFDLLAKQADYPSKVKAGRYHITKGMSNWNLVRMLRSGRQAPVKLILGKMRTKTDFVRAVSTKLEADSNVLRQMLADNVYLSQFGLDSATAMCGVMPDTYEFFWNTNADKAFRKIAANYKRFWSAERLSKAQALNLKPTEAIIMASIVEEESNKRDEQPNIASVYLNRMAKGMRLQADPTAKWAAGDFAIKRITSVHTSIPSPYNTYYIAGLPPGPICTPSPKTIDAVLAAPKTNYLYFCAKEDFSGYHRFAANYDEHMRNAALYQQALNARGVH